MIYVLDASFVAAQIIPDEKNPRIEKMYSKIKPDDEKLAPHLIWYEIANLFQNLLRRKRYADDKIMEFFPFLIAMRLKCDFETGPDYTKKLLLLSSEYGLSSYDAVYLELAERKNAALCTFDKKLQAAAKKHGVPVLE
jgi:predicted nucleic acid-binding protein